jgi:hypothetical protein
MEVREKNKAQEKDFLYLVLFLLAGSEERAFFALSHVTTLSGTNGISAIISGFMIEFIKRGRQNLKRLQLKAARSFMTRSQLSEPAC